MEGFLKLPEGPELKHSRDVLTSQIVGCAIKPMVFLGRYAQIPPIGYDELIQRIVENTVVIDAINVKGKLMWWDFVATTGQLFHMLCTYGMSGQWTLKLPDKHAACIIPIERLDRDEPRIVSFRDPRHFGTLKFVSTVELDKKQRSLGPDMLGDPPALDVFTAIMKKHPTLTVAQALMKQNIISGVGNYIKAEALYRARVSPHRTLGSLTDIEMGLLYHEITAVMREAYQAKGATIRSYRTPQGDVGAAQFRFQVYGRKVDDFGNVVVREETLDKRTTHWVPMLQR